MQNTKTYLKTRFKKEFKRLLNLSYHQSMPIQKYEFIAPFSYQHDGIWIVNVMLYTDDKLFPLIFLSLKDFFFALIFESWLGRLFADLWYLVTGFHRKGLKITWNFSGIEGQHGWYLQTSYNWNAVILCNQSL